MFPMNYLIHCVSQEPIRLDMFSGVYNTQLFFEIGLRLWGQWLLTINPRIRYYMYIWKCCL